MQITRTLFTAFTLSLITFTSSCQDSLSFFPADNMNIVYTGRVDFSDPKKPEFAWPGVSVSVRFEGKTCQAKMGNYSSIGQDGKPYLNYYTIILDSSVKTVSIPNGTHILDLGKNLKNGIHTLTIFKRTEAFCGTGDFEGFFLEKGKKLLEPVSIPERKLEFIGNSITCGYGNEGNDQNCHFSPKTENNYLSYAAITARNLQAQYVATAYSGKGIYINYDKTTTGTLPQLFDRILPFDPDLKWDFTQYIPDAVIINLGTNDFAHEVPDSSAFVSSYAGLIRKILEVYPQTVTFCLEGPMISDTYPPGHQSASICKEYIEAAMAEFPDKKLYFFKLSTQGKLGFGCDWHPNLAQHQLNADELTGFIKEKMGW